MRIVGISSPKLIVVGCTFLIAAALSACGGSNTSDPISACKSTVSAVCDRSFQCFPTESQQFYGSVANCNAAVSAHSCTPTLTTCPAGLAFNSDAASRCVDDYRNVSCPDILNGILPASCNQTCN
jgi:hypothetical protein